MIQYLKSAVSIGILGASALLVPSCEKAQPFQGDSQSEDDFGITVRDTLIDTLVVSGDTLTDLGAYRITFTVIKAASWDSSAGEPAFLEIYKRYPDGPENFVSRIFAGGGGVQVGETVYFRNPEGTVDTVPYSGRLEALLVKSGQDKQRFYFGVAVRSGLKKAGSRTYESGGENNRIFSNILLGGGNTRSISINGGAPVTANNVVELRARFDTTGVDTLYYFRISSSGFLRFDYIFAMDSALDSSVGSPAIPFLGGLELNGTDSSIIDAGKIPIGKFGGKFPIPARLLSDHFDSVASAGEPGWVDVVKRDTLVGGFGKKWVFLTGAGQNWRSPLYENIDIAPYGGELVPDLNTGNWRINALERKACLNQDAIPFSFNIFGDTTYEDSIWVWLATRNLSGEFMSRSGNDWKLSNFLIDKNANELEYGAEWSDAVLETPSRGYGLGAAGIPAGTLTPDFEKDYRVSPFFLSYYDTDNRRLYYPDFNGVQRQIINRPNSPLLSRIVKRGSILGYDEMQLNKFLESDSILDVKGGIVKLPAPGWYQYIPLGDISPDSAFSPANLLNYFRNLDPGLTDQTKLYPAQKATGSDYYAAFSAYFYSPDNPLFKTASKLFYLNGGGVKLYRNPFRNLPYFITRNSDGSKEFVLIAYTRGKYFKEPRVFISSFFSLYRTVWDKTPPHFVWAASVNPTDDTYAPYYYVNDFDVQKRTVSDLSSTSTPNVFEVHFNNLSADISQYCSVRELGFGRINSVKLMFNYSADFLGLDPVTGERKYKSGNINPAAVDERTISRQSFSNFGLNRAGYSLDKISFSGIDGRLWRAGVWDMWIETEDDLGNFGVAPINQELGYSIEKGILSVRQIQIK